MINPDEISTIQSDAIATPDILGVDIGDSEILKDDVGRADQPKTFAFDGSTTFTHEGLIAADGDAENTRIVVGNGHGRGVGLVVGAPVILVDGNLAGGRSTPGRTSGRRRGALGAGEVVSTLNDDDTGDIVSKV